MFIDEAKHLWRKSIVFALLWMAPVAVSFAAGTIQLRNNAGSLVQWYTGTGVSTVPVSTDTRLVFGVFWKTNESLTEPLTLALPLASSSSSTAGLIIAPEVFPIPGTEPGQKVFIQIKGWREEYGSNWLAAETSSGFGLTPICEVTLGPDTGPGTVIWQGRIGTDPNKLYPLTLNVPLTPPVFVTFAYQPNLSIVVDEGNRGVINVPLTINRFANGPPSNLNASTTVLLSTKDITAVGGFDYIPANLLITFPPGSTQQRVSVQVTGDSLPEPDEQFRVRIVPTSGVVGALYDSMMVTIREARVISIRREAAVAMVTIQTTSTQHYALESSVDLLSWSTVPGAENIIGTGAPIEVADSGLDECPARFYRTRILP